MLNNVSQSNGSDNDCTVVDDLMKRYYLPVMYGIIFVVGFVGNITSILIYVVKVRPWKSNIIIMVNLAITDLLYVFSLPFLIYYYANGDDWTMGEFMCRFVRFSFHFNLYGSILFLTCISAFRYVVVVHPMRAAQVQRKRWGILACLLVWLISAGELTPMLTMINFVENKNQTRCLDFASNDPPELIWLYSWLLSVLGYLLPLVVVCFFYISIVRELAKGPHTESPHRTRARRITVVVLVVFVVCFLPFHILRAVRIDTRRRAVSCMITRGVHAAYIISRPVAGLNTFFNLILYTLARSQFLKSFLDLFQIPNCFRKDKSDITVAIVTKSSSF